MDDGDSSSNNNNKSIHLPLNRILRLLGDLERAAGFHQRQIEEQNVGRRSRFILRPISTRAGIFVSGNSQEIAVQIQPITGNYFMHPTAFKTNKLK